MKFSSEQLSLPTPSQIVRHLDEYVKGQQQAKQAVALSLYSHLLYLACRDNPSGLESAGINLSFNPQHFLVIGSTGCGKSYLIQKATEYIGLTSSFVSATSLVQTGYVGMSINKMMESHYQRCEQNIKRAERAVVFIDEIDKIRTQDASGGIDVSGEGVQNALLTLLDGKPVCLSENGSSDASHKIEIDTGGIIFICAGAFAAGLPDIIRSRLTSNAQSTDIQDADILAYAQTEDLVKFGFIPEFIGRFSNLAVLNSLKVDDLVGIMQETKESALQKHKTFFALHGIDLVFTKEALKEIAKQAIQLNTGARGLNRIIKEQLLTWEYQLPELADSGVSQIEIDQYALWEGQASLKYSQGKQSKRIKLSQIRQQGLENLQSNVSSLNSDSRQSFFDITGLNDSQIKAKLEEVKSKISWEKTTGSAKKWWLMFERENQHQLGMVLRLAEELKVRNATISEFFLAYVYSNTDNIKANLHYLDYTRLKKLEERKKREQATKNLEENKTESASLEIKVEETPAQVNKSELPKDAVKGSYSLILQKYSRNNKIAVFNAIHKMLQVTRGSTGVCLTEAQDLIESPLPIVVHDSLSRQHADKFKQQFRQAGASVVIAKTASRKRKKKRKF